MPTKKSRTTKRKTKKRSTINKKVLTLAAANNWTYAQAAYQLGYGRMGIAPGTSYNCARKNKLGCNIDPTCAWSTKKKRCHTAKSAYIPLLPSPNGVQRHQSAANQIIWPDEFVQGADRCWSRTSIFGKTQRICPRRAWP